MFHSNGILAAFKRTANWQLVEEKRWDNSGNPLDLGLFREASIVGGPEAWDNFLGSNLNYPSEARSDRAEGMVYLAFQLDEEGRISEIEVMNPEDVHPALANEALRVMKKYRKNFSPKVENGNPVKTEMYLPIRFKL
ncbi:energy transducer TonB [Mariniradius sediminis]|uniref:Energy transducer TonB n=1 Tax=Mariniradius sediminis TaxID=2909237 RepID=A0ABS9BR47_9BACT|nr:energy transducer TonB [Mariniradius sediminis]